jgi:hypothetical protein
MPSQLTNIDKNVSSIVAKLNTPSVTIDYLCPPPRLNIPYTNVQANVYGPLNGGILTPTGIKNANSQCLSQLGDNMIVNYADKINSMNLGITASVNKDLPINLPCIYDGRPNIYAGFGGTIDIPPPGTPSPFKKSNINSYIPSYMLSQQQVTNIQSFYFPLGGWLASPDLLRTVLDVNGNPIGINVSNINMQQIGGQIIQLANLCYTPPTSSILSKPNDLVCQKQYCDLLNNDDFIIAGTQNNGESQCIINGNTKAGLRDINASIPTSGGICANFNTPS